MSDTCPNGCDLTGVPIPQEYIDAGLYPSGRTHYSRMIGVEVRDVYDGVLFWRCPDCKIAWPRFAAPDPRHKAAVYYIEENS
jgi:hypothetical protein